MPRRLGSEGPTVFPLALGCMGMSGMYGQSEDDESVATIYAALDQGVTPLDTGDFYAMGHNEMHCAPPPPPPPPPPLRRNQMKMLDSERGKGSSRTILDARRDEPVGVRERRPKAARRSTR